MNEFTPGPWKALHSNAGWRIKSEEVVGYILKGWYCRTPEEGAANMRLAAAAPDMYRYLKLICANDGVLHHGDCEDLNLLLREIDGG